MTEQYKIKAEGFGEIRKQIIIRTIPMGLIALAVGIGISVYNSDGQDNQVSVLPIVIPICLGALAFGISKGLNRQKLLFESYKLSISNDEIIREQTNTPTIRIPYSDINSIIKDDKGNFSIKGNKALDIIGVPSQIENYEQLEKLLNQILPIETKNQVSSNQKYQILSVLLTLGFMATIYISTNKFFVGISGTLLSGILIWSFIQVQRNKNIDNKTKRGSYLTILVLFSVIVTMIVKLTTK